MKYNLLLERFLLPSPRGDEMIRKKMKFTKQEISCRPLAGMR